MIRKIIGSVLIALGIVFTVYFITRPNMRVETTVTGHYEVSNVLAGDQFEIAEYSPPVQITIAAYYDGTLTDAQVEAAFQIRSVNRLISSQRAPVPFGVTGTLASQTELLPNSSFDVLSGTSISIALDAQGKTFTVIQSRDEHAIRWFLAFLSALVGCFFGWLVGWAKFD